MNRRNFLSLLGMTAGGLALEKAVPFNRVWSFPKKIVIAGNYRFSMVQSARQLIYTAERSGLSLFEVGDAVSIAGDHNRYRLKKLVSSGQVGNFYGFAYNDEFSTELA